MAGPVLNSEHLLESVVRITAQRDRETLEVCLVGTLRDLLDASRVSIVRVVPVSDTLVAEIVATRGRDAFEDGKDSFVQVLPAEVEQVALLRAARRIEGIVETTLPDDAGRHVTAWPYATAQGSSEGFLVVEDARP
ncbi:MAG TPA: hypothetical protein VEB64_17210, partial [Azospirillaceae bacterium]|nr:hypothetical protein [Azospirillaceae bacterium]